MVLSNTDGMMQGGYNSASTKSYDFVAALKLTRIAVIKIDQPIEFFESIAA